MTQQTERRSDAPATRPPPRQNARRKAQRQDVHHHHHYHARERKPREVDMSGEPFAVVKSRVKMRALRGALISVALSPILAGVTWSLGTTPVTILIAGAIPAIFGLVFLFSRHLTPNDYYQIQGSRYADGKHRCIACGHSGIWRHSPYRSNHTVAQCANGACGVQLWREPKG